MANNELFETNITGTSSSVEKTLQLKRDTNTATAEWGTQYVADDSASAEETYAKLNAIINTNTAGSEDGGLILYAIDGGTLKEVLRVQEDGVVVNDGSDAALDFRVETDSEGNAFLVDASANTAEFRVPLTIGSDSATDALSVNGPAASLRALQWKTAGSNRWLALCEATAESGADAGSKWQLLARTDAGAAIDAVMDFVRASGGTMTFGGTTDRPVVFTGNATVQGALVQNIGTTFPDGDATPSVADGNVFKCGAQTTTVTITALDDGTAGQEVTIIAIDADTDITDGGTLKLSANWTPDADDTITLVFDGTNWFEKSRSAN
jgi:hypothetical protein